LKLFTAIDASFHNIAISTIEVPLLQLYALRLVWLVMQIADDKAAI
jgi:hypothetical protein